MDKLLTNSKIDRQNILYNPFAIEEISKATGFKGIIFENEIKFTLSQIAQIFETDDRTIKRYLEKYPDELKENGYFVLRGKRLKEFKLTVKELNVRDINVPSKTTALGIFNFRSLLNLAMLLVESERAKVLRGVILDIAIDTINKKTGGSVKYINQRDEDFILSYFQNENYRKEFTDALRDYVDMGNAKYAIYTNKVYRSIFRENANEYRQILRLEIQDNTDCSVREKVDILQSEQ